MSADITVIPPRSWVGVAPAAPRDRVDSFVIVSYNILAPVFAEGGFAYCPPECLEWAYRWRMIQAEVMRLVPDICCMQEVQYNCFSENLAPFFRALGLKGSFTRGGQRRGVDVGTATFSRTASFDFVAAHTLAIRALSARPEFMERLCGSVVGGSEPWTPAEVVAHHKIWSWLASMHHSGLALVLRHRASKRLLVVGNFHAYWDPSYPQMKALQLALVSMELDRIRQGCGAGAGAVSVVLCGDFNVMPTILCDGRFEDLTLLARTEELSSSPPGSSLTTVPVRHCKVQSGAYLALSSGALPAEHPHHPLGRSMWRGPQALAAAPAALHSCKASCLDSDAGKPSCEMPEMPPTPALHALSAPSFLLPLRFASAYLAVAGAEPPWTNWHGHEFKETLDYIFVATHSREVRVVVGADERGRGAAAAAAAGQATAKDLRDSLPHLSAVIVAAGTPERASTASSGKACDRASPRSPVASLPTGLAAGSALAAGPWTSLPPSSSGLQAVGVLGVPADADVLRCRGASGGGCPNAGCGSDHIPIAALLRWL